MEARLDALETKLNNSDRVVARLEVAEDEVAKLITIKEDFGNKLKDRLDLMEAEAKNKSEMMMMDLQKLLTEATKKFQETDANMATLYNDAKAKFAEIEQKIHSDEGHRGGGGHKKQGLLPDKMMIPKVLQDDVSTWRKWKEDVSKYFDEE